VLLRTAVRDGGNAPKFVNFMAANIAKFVNSYQKASCFFDII
jgi:hypothetical protein